MGRRTRKTFLRKGLPRCAATRLDPALARPVVERLEQRLLLTLPAILAIERALPTGADTNLTAVYYQITFSEPVTNVSAADFVATTTGSLNGTVALSLSGSGADYFMAVNGIQGSGTLRLDLIDDDSIQNLAGDPLGGPGVANGNFLGEFYAIDQRAPYVVAIDRDSPAGPATGAASVTFAVTFSEPVAGVDLSDFQVVTTGSASATSPLDIIGVGAAYTVTVHGIAGSGTLGLNLVDNGSIRDPAGNRLIPVSSPAATFGNQTMYSTGLVPNSVFLGDLNFDGNSDLVVANFLSNNVGVLLGDGQGGFAPQVTYPVPASPVSAAVRDVNSDGLVDLLVANYSGNSVSVLLGNGDGTFQPQVTFPVGASPESVIAVDVNRDGYADLVVANSVGNSVSILLGNGDGTFQPHVETPVGVKPYQVTAADVNHDGNLDLAVANDSDNSAGILLGNGNGTFQPQFTLSSLLNPRSVAFGDLNGDTHPDLVAANFGGNAVSVWLGNGNGTFQSRADFSAGWKPQAVTLSDVNQDGTLDAVLVNLGDSNAGILLGNGNGTFQSQSVFATGTNPQSIAVGDLNHDSKPDLAVANFVSGNASVLLGNSSGNFNGQVYTVQAATRLEFLDPPGTTVVGSPINAPVGVRVATTDNSGAIITDNNSTVLLTLVGGTFAGGGVTAVAPVLGGIATFNNLVIDASGQYALQASSGPLAGNSVPSFQVTSAVVARSLFYEGSTRFDVTNAHFPGYSNDNAIAVDKQAFMAGNGAATFTNLSSYSRGINGVMVDLLGLPVGGTLSAADFVFRVGNDNAPQSWAAAPAPLAISLRPGAGQGGSDRIELFWANNVIQKQWLQVAVLANERTGLISPDVFYFGHALADTGLGNSATNATVNTTDELAARNNSAGLSSNIPISSLYDFNRDGQVNASDQLLARNNSTTVATATRLINLDAVSGSSVVGRHLFYEGSSRYDVTNAQFPGYSNDNAIAADKVALLPGSGPATFANLSSYSQGINGLMIDLSAGGLHAGISAADFIFKVGNNNSPSTWVAAPSPLSISVRTGAGAGGSDRVDIMWSAGSIHNTWLEVTVRATANTGLTLTDVFYFGNAVGDSGLGDTATQATVSVNDALGARNNPKSIFNNIPTTNIFDFNRDGQVNTTDQLIARNNPSSVANVVRFLNIASPPATPEANSQAWLPTESPSVAVELAVEDSAAMPEDAVLASLFGSDDDWLDPLADDIA